MSMLGEITPAGREHFKGKLEETHGAFKALVAALPAEYRHRPSPMATPGSPPRR